MRTPLTADVARLECLGVGVSFKNGFDARATLGKFVMNWRLQISRAAAGGIAALIVAGASLGVSAQELEPRAYSPSPLGVNFLGLSYLQSSGGGSVPLPLTARLCAEASAMRIP